MKKDVRVFLLDILECIEKIEEYTGDISKEEFLGETWIQDAVLRRVEVIGEAAKNIPDSFKKTHPGLPWSEMARTRDRLIHGYFGVNLERVWVIVKDDLPDLKKKIKKIQEDLETS
ncbi:MAG: DUF86 domain-containing protein [Candidatus Altiarchaeota archaeon]|nr:DUF86 domain-containing protein [Candidatus Altiarchaeota archaeon]